MSQWIYPNPSLIENFLSAIKYSFKEKANFCLLPLLKRVFVKLAEYATLQMAFSNFANRYEICDRSSPTYADYFSLQPLLFYDRVLSDKTSIFVFFAPL
jgi:hypothetical protein